MKAGELVAPEGGHIVGPAPDDADHDTEAVPCDYCDTEDGDERAGVLAAQTAEGQRRVVCATHLVAMLDAVLRPRVEETTEDTDELMEGTPWGE